MSHSVPFWKRTPFTGFLVFGILVGLHSLLHAQDLPRLGDINGDGVATVEDLAPVVSHFNGLRPLPADQEALADVNLDGVIDRADSALILEAILGKRELPLALTRVWLTSPGNGDTGVAVTRETIIRFTGPLASDNEATAQTIYAEFGGVRVPARLATSPDLKSVTLFYTIDDGMLPASARIRVTIDGDQLSDARGVAVDADNDGVPGGRREIEFDTLTLTVVQDTTVCGRVFASRLANTDAGAEVNQPLEGVKITVDGRESTIFTTTDNNGDFRLENCPAGRFFVHIDGRNAVLPPEALEGSYYPNVGKAWTSIPGEEVNIGEIYLPVIPPDTLKEASVTEETMLTFPQSFIDEHPEFTDVIVRVPPGSLTRDDGSVGGMVGIAPVDPNRLPGALPDNLTIRDIVTVQTDGATNFSEPVPICLPNLPDEQGNVLPPGAKSALLSFNHDTGRFEVVGSMTVSEDGSQICSDPGSGILAPGWHGQQPAAGLDGGDLGPDTPDPDPDKPQAEHPNAPEGHRPQLKPKVFDHCEDEEMPDEPHSQDDNPDDEYADPIYYFSGEFYETVVDMRIKGRGQDFVWQRKYRSRDGVSSLLGNNWDIGHNIFLEFRDAPPLSPSRRKQVRIIAESNGGSGGSSISFYPPPSDPAPPPQMLVLCTGSGRADYFNELQEGKVWGKPAFFQEIVKLRDGSFHMTFQNRGRWEFYPIDGSAQSGKISANVDRNGNAIRYFYDSQGPPGFHPRHAGS